MSMAGTEFTERFVVHFFVETGVRLPTVLRCGFENLPSKEKKAIATGVAHLSKAPGDRFDNDIKMLRQQNPELHRELKRLKIK